MSLALTAAAVPPSASNSKKIQDALDLKDGCHVCKVGSAPRATHHALVLKFDEAALFPKSNPVKGLDCAQPISAIEAYLRAAGSQIPGYEVGCYGSYFVIEEMFRRGVCNWHWQTVGWSEKNICSHAHLYQYKIDTKLSGHPVDLNEAYTDEGFWTLQKGGV